MGIVSGGGGGGTFNGGTIHNALAIVPTSPNTDLLGITVPASMNAEVLKVVDTDTGRTILDIDSFGSFVFRSGGSNSSFSVRDGGSSVNLNYTNGGGLSYTSAGDTLFAFDSTGAIYTHANAAPADAALSAGQCAFWFDQTNAAAKAMFKGKTANGTVVTAAVALS